MHSQQLELSFEGFTQMTDLNSISNPKGYTGFSSFHKYWGKKPLESLNFLISNLTDIDDIILDPFLGSGLLALESINQHRRFIGIDINPISIELAKLFTDMPSKKDLELALHSIDTMVSKKINDCYRLYDGNFATHYLWEEDAIKSVWLKNIASNKRAERIPIDFDYDIVNSFIDYQCRNIRQLRFFDNSRINSKSNLSIYDFFTRRALFSIDLLLDSFSSFDDRTKRALKLILTSASGQMSNMVFAISNRGKKSGQISERIEVGSWAIGFWRPNLHFEINVWNCFSQKAYNLLKTYSADVGLINTISTTNAELVIDDVNKLCLVNSDAKDYLSKLPDRSISLIITDPPHGDRIPYLELSEIWNAIISNDSNFADEIVVSNAKSRNKNSESYNVDMGLILHQIFRVLKKDGFLALMFNSADRDYWNFLSNSVDTNPDISFLGCYPMNYSASSIVQDNRDGALKRDFVLVYCKAKDGAQKKGSILTAIPGWRTTLPI